MRKPQKNSIAVIILSLLFSFLFCVSCRSGFGKDDLQNSQITITDQIVFPTLSMEGETKGSGERLTQTPISINFSMPSQGEVYFKLPGNMFKPTIDKNMQWLTFGLNVSIESNEQGVSVYNIATCKINLSNSQTLLCSQLHLPLINETWFTYVSDFSPDGKYFAISTSENIWIFETKNWTQIVNVNKSKIRADIAWSPDSQGIAVQFDEEENALYYIRLDGTKTPLLTKDDVFPEGFPPLMPGVTEWGPTWSPDGKQIAYIKYFPDHEELWVKDVISGQSQMLYKGTGPLGVNPKWSPNGRYISMYGLGLEVFDIQTRKMLTFLKSPYLIHQDFFDDNYAWSPKENQIAVELKYNEPDKSGLYVLDIDTGVTTFIKPGSIHPNQWFSDNTLVFTYYENEIDSFLGWMMLKK